MGRVQDAEKAKPALQACFVPQCGLSCAPNDHSGQGVVPCLLRVDDRNQFQQQLSTDTTEVKIGELYKYCDN